MNPTSQPMLALGHANRIRLHRAAVKRRLRMLPLAAGMLEVVAKLEHPEPELDGMAVYDLMCACRHAQRALVFDLLSEAGMSERTTVAGMTDRQRLWLCADIEDRYGRKAQMLRVAA